MLKRAFALRKVIVVYIDSDVEVQKYVLKEHVCALKQEVINLLEQSKLLFRSL